MAKAKQPFQMGRLVMDMVTERRTLKGKHAVHLFVGFVNGAISGHPVSFCGIITEHTQKWEAADGQSPLCNHCGRAFHKDRKLWEGLP